ncbi:MAG: type III secretion system chaperone [Ottowia sp.]|nr:type III secretion system chaperone [Ottowia sp.]
MEASTLISLLGERTGCALSFGDAGTLSLVFDNEVIVNIEHDTSKNGLHLYVVLGPEPASEATRYAIYRKLLSSNAFGYRLTGGTLGLDEKMSEFLLTRYLSVDDTDVDELHAALEALVDGVPFCQSLLNPSVADNPTAIPSVASFGRMA